MTADVASRITRLMVASQARRWTVASGMVAPFSSCPAGAPRRPWRVSRLAVTWRWERWLARAGTAPLSRRWATSSTERVGEALVALAVLIGAARAGERFQRGAQEHAALGVEAAGDGEPAPLAGAQPEPAPVDVVGLAGDTAGGVDGVLGVLAGRPEAGDGVALGGAQQRRLVDLLRDGTGGGELRGLGHETELGDADATGKEGLEARRQLGLVLADLERGDRGVAGHPALVADPRGGAVVELGVGRHREAIGDAREDELEAVDEGAGEPEVLAELVVGAGWITREGAVVEGAVAGEVIRGDVGIEREEAVDGGAEGLELGGGGRLERHLEHGTRVPNGCSGARDIGGTM